MSNVCGVITAGLAPSCTSPLVNGVNDRLILLNKNDVIGTTRNVTDDDIIEAITLATGKTGFAFEGQNHSVEPATRLVRGRYSTNFDHEVTFKIFSDDAIAKQQINLLVNGLFIAVVENNWLGDTDDSGAFTLYGTLAGLEVAELEQIKSDAESEGGWNVVLRTPEMAKEPRLPNSVFITDYTTTLAMVDGLL